MVVKLPIELYDEYFIKIFTINTVLNMSTKEGSQEEKRMLASGSPKSKENEFDAANEDDISLCGVGSLRPACVQVCARMGVFVGIYSLSGLITSVLSMYIVSQITAIERQYGISSAQSGFLLSCNDIGFLMTTLFASYFARRVHIPRVLGVTVVMYGVAGIICSMAYFISKDHSLKLSSRLLDMTISSDRTMQINVSLPGSAFNVPALSSMCVLKEDSERDAYEVATLLPNVTSQCVEREGIETTFGIGVPNEYTKVAIAFLAIGMMIQGVAKAPRYPFLATYIDDNVHKKNTAMYMGIISGIGIFGPAIAFSVGGLFSRQYVTLQDVPISPRHPAWVGAWWLGFVVFGIIAIVISVPLYCFPRAMRRRRAAKMTTTNAVGSGPSSTAAHTVKGFFSTFLRLLTNPVYFPMVISSCITLFGVAGLLAFSAKYLETQFSIPAWKANVLLGAMNILAAAAGSFVGGLVVTKRRLSPPACIKLLVCLAAITFVQTALLYVFGCSNADISGFNYQSTFPGSSDNMTCGAACGCSETSYYPLCGSDGKHYMSPCHAGCTVQTNMTFQNCSCVAGEGRATPGLCDTACVMLYPYLINNVFAAFISTLCIMPTFIVTLRSVSEKDKPVAVGFSSLLATLCGFLTAPIVFGVVIDTSCLVWSESCSGKGACALYDIEDFRLKIVSLMSGPKALTLIVYICVYLKARKKTDWTVEETIYSAKDEAIGEGDNDAKLAMMTSCDVELATIEQNKRNRPIFKGHVKNGDQKLT